MLKSHQSKRALRIRLNMDLAPTGMELLTPKSSMRWDNCAFELNPPPGGKADFCVVLANARPIDNFHSARCNTLFIAGEPPEKKVYARKFYAQFQHIVDTHDLSQHAGVILSAPGLNWHVGLDMSSREYRYGYDYLSNLEYPQKQNKIAVVCSDADSTPGQRRRLALLEFLKKRLGDSMIHFGRGFEPIDDKMEAILPYRYQLVLENSQSPNYWTEKLSDAYLGWAFPIYLGCPNIEDYFPGNSFMLIDSNDFEAAENKIRGLLDSPIEPSQQAMIAQARDLILNKYNPFAWSAYWAQRLYRPDTKRALTIRTHKAFRPFPRGMLYRCRQIISTRR